MDTITPRIPAIDWGTAFEPHWNGGNAATSHAFNALSFMFPQGERFFIRVTREVSSGLDLSQQPRLKQAVQAFITQEALHTREHEHYNAVLNQQGFENVAHDTIERLQARAHRFLSPLTRLAAVCAYEHFTAILGHYLLHHPQVLKTAPGAMALIWGWHAAEETEHKAVCFDLYRAADGGELRRIAMFLLVSMDFLILYTRLYFHFLYRDGALKPRRLFTTLRQSMAFFWGRTGVGWTLATQGLRYLIPGFHPWKLNDRDMLTRWLKENGPQLRPFAAE